MQVIPHPVRRVSGHQQNGTANFVCMNGVPWFLHERGTPDTTAPDDDNDNDDKGRWYLRWSGFCKEKGTAGKAGVSAMTDCHTGFVVQCKGDPDYPKFQHYRCIIRQQALCARVMGLDHLMTAAAIKILNSIHSEAEQYRSFKVLFCWMVTGY